MEQGENLEAIEALPLLGQDRMNLVLTYFGEKPCSTIEIDYFGKDPLADIKETKGRKTKLEEALTVNGLEFSIIETEEPDENGFDHKEFKFLVSKDRDKLRELQRALEEDDIETIGKLYGFPDTAVDAFIEGSKKGRLFDTMLDEREWWRKMSPKDKKALLQEGVLGFMNFKFSKEHWQEELEQLRKWQ